MEERANLSAFGTFVWFALVWFCLFPLPLGVWEGLRFMILALPGLFLTFSCRSEIAKIVLIRNQDSRRGCHLESLFFASSDLKGQLTVNLVEKRPKIATIGNLMYILLLLLNQKANWLKTCRLFRSKIQVGPNGRHIFFNCPEWKGQLTSKLGMKHRGDSRWKVAKSFPIGNPRWSPLWPSWKSIDFCFWIERSVVSKR